MLAVIVFPLIDILLLWEIRLGQSVQANVVRMQIDFVELWSTNEASLLQEQKEDDAGEDSKGYLKPLLVRFWPDDLEYGVSLLPTAIFQSLRR